jgi:hypothetical protein
MKETKKSEVEKANEKCVIVYGQQHCLRDNREQERVIQGPECKNMLYAKV